MLAGREVFKIEKERDEVRSFRRPLQRGNLGWPSLLYIHCSRSYQTEDHIWTTNIFVLGDPIW
jgi:hypothetical protein